MTPYKEYEFLICLGDGTWYRHDMRVNDLDPIVDARRQLSEAYDPNFIYYIYILRETPGD
jgi:hypothetical protein